MDFIQKKLGLGPLYNKGPVIQLAKNQEKKVGRLQKGPKAILE